MKALLFILVAGFMDVTFGIEQSETSIGLVKETASKIRLAVLKDEGDKIDSKLQDLVRAMPAKNDCLNARADEAKKNIKWALETYIDPLLSEIDQRKRNESGTTKRHERQQDYYTKYIEERAQSAMTYAQTEADAATLWFASEALNC